MGRSVANFVRGFLLTRRRSVARRWGGKNPLTKFATEPPLSLCVTGSCKGPIEHLPQGTIASRQGSGEEIAQALRQVVSAPKVKYMHFDGNPMKYI